MVELTASESDAGERLDAFLAKPLGSRARAQRLIEAGAVLVDGAEVPKRHRVAAGELVGVGEGADPPPPADPSETADFAIAYEDEHLVVVDKPAGVVVHPARGHWQGTPAQGAGGGPARGRGRVSRRHRASPRPRHVRVARRGEVRRRAHRTEGGTAAAR